MMRLRLLFFIAFGVIAAAAAAHQTATPVLWKDPGSIGEKNLRWGAGSEERQPKATFTFVKEDLSGSKPKVRVIDANGVDWNVKFAGARADKNEVNAEVAASRLAWALGFIAEENYFVPHGTIEKVSNLQRAGEAIQRDGTFTTARFERRESNSERGGRRWTFESNPFTGTRELSGLKLLLALSNNWDNKRENTSIDTVTLADGTREEQYLISDWGASFGRMSGPPSWAPAPTRWQPSHFREQPFVKGVNGDSVQIFYIGQVPIESIPLDHARWFAELAGQLHVEQLHDAFTAAGAPEADAQTFAARVVEKIASLKTAVQSSAR
jgi:hypothetical protein